MGSLNDYGRGDLYGREPRPHRLRRRLLAQCGLAALLFCAVAALVGSDGLPGQAARWLAGPGLAADSSWLALDQGLYAVSARPEAGEETGADTGDETGTEAAAGGTDAETAAAPGVTEDTADTEPPRFTAPASGVVVSDLAVTADGAPAQQGILIQGSAGQRVRAAAAGTVQALSSEDGLYRLEIAHSGGFTSIYQGLSQIDVALGDRVELGDPVGACAGGELDFSLLHQGEAVDPLVYLFN